MKNKIFKRKIVFIICVLMIFYNAFYVFAENPGKGDRVDGIIGLKEKENENKALEFYSKYLGKENTDKIKNLIKNYDEGDKTAYGKIEDIISLYNPNEKSYIANYLVYHRTFYPYCLCSIEHEQYSNIVSSIIVNDVAIDIEEVKGIWSLIKNHIPYHMAKNISYLNIDIGRPEGSLMSINPVDDICEKWQISIDRELVYKKDLFVKCLTKIIPAYVFFNCNYIDLEAKENSDSFKFYNNIYQENSPIAEYYRQFWRGKRIIKEPFTNSDIYLTDMCKENCMEDFIETFSYVVFNGHYEKRGMIWEKTSFILDENLITKDYIEEVRGLLKLY